MSPLPTRKNSRLSHYDYNSAGSYFITVCTHKKQHLLGRIVGGGVLDAPYVRLSEYGRIVEQALLEMNAFDDDITVAQYVIMPNHVHFILSILEGPGPSRTPAPTNARLPAFLSTWKRLTNKRAGIPLWQRSYYDHIIRSRPDYLRI